MNDISKELTAIYVFVFMDNFREPGIFLICGSSFCLSLNLFISQIIFVGKLKKKKKSSSRNMEGLGKEINYFGTSSGKKYSLKNIYTYHTCMFT